MKALWIVLCIIAIIIPIIVYGCGIIKCLQCDVNCIGYLKLAADASTAQLAEKHLTTAIEYLEVNNITYGNTGIIIKAPSNDIGIWYENLKSAQASLHTLNQQEGLTDLEESNALMKLRETLLDDTSITHPSMISFVPNHVSWFWSMALIWLLWILARFFGIAAAEAY